MVYLQKYENGFKSYIREIGWDSDPDVDNFFVQAYPNSYRKHVP